MRSYTWVFAIIATFLLYLPMLDAAVGRCSLTLF